MVDIGEAWVPDGPRLVDRAEIKIGSDEAPNVREIEVDVSRLKTGIQNLLCYAEFSGPYYDIETVIGNAEVRVEVVDGKL